MYREHFGLNELPFGLTPDPEFMCLQRQHQLAMQTLMVALDSGEGFVKVTGEVGTGKTLLCRRLIAAQPESVVTAYLLTPRLKPAALLKALAQELGLHIAATADAQAVHHAIEQELIRLSAAGRRVVCCIDEAHALPPASLEALRLLSNVETRKRKLIQMALFGQPELNDLLMGPQLRSLASRLAFGAELTGMSLPDCRRYLQHRMVVAGWQGSPMFTPAAAGLLWHASRGVPRLVNLFAHQCLMLAYGHGVREVRALDVLQVWRERRRLFAQSHRAPVLWEAPR